MHIHLKNLLHIHPLTTVCTSLQWVPVSKQLPALHKQHEHIVAAADRNLPQWADSVLHSAVATRAQTNSHIFFSLLFSSVNTQAKDGRVKQRGFGGTRFLLCRYAVLQADTLAIVNWTQTLKEMAALYHQKDSFILCFDFQLPNLRYLLFTLSIKFVAICIPGIRIQ